MGKVQSKKGFPLPQETANLPAVDAQTDHRVNLSDLPRGKGYRVVPTSPFKVGDKRQP